MLPVNSGSHSAYQNFVVEMLRKYYPNPDSIARSTWDIIKRFWNLDLSYTDSFLKCRYSPFGPKPRLPSCMKRSYLLSIDFKVTSITYWAAQLKINPLYALLSGFQVGDTPGAGIFYDFFKRFWNADDDNLSSHLRPLKASIKKPKKKGEKADPIEKLTVEHLFKELEETTFSLDEQPYGSLFQLFKSEFLDVSVHKKLINPHKLSLAGDGTPVVASAREQKHRFCRCASKGINNCNCDRYFSQPDCDMGWDSSRD
ncbi:hypothetical protein [Lacrimispora sp.]|uniref:hypothetical protein n=1 Tax=Lacrimispora sp. TaxID=2719234 RepID=UPI0029DFB73D|nr:hypothetical protein [Lacrimispora sp.]